MCLKFMCIVTQIIAFGPHKMAFVPQRMSLLLVKKIVQGFFSELHIPKFQVGQMKVVILDTNRFYDL